ncbi:MAG: amidase [Myxococcota bacterium]
MDPFASATETVRALRGREIGALELLEAQLARIERFNGKLNAIIWSDFERAREEARAFDAAQGRGGGRLAGLPMTVKESFNVTGAPTTWGMPLLKGNVAMGDSVVVERLRRDGAIVLGKTNVPLALGDLQSYNEIYGSTGNPWDPSRTPGGSSGGAAAALASGMVPLEVGSDIGGSIRNPAHYCGVFGHKPTWGLIPVRGHSLPGAISEPDIAVVGPLARSAADLDLALDVLAGADELDAGVRYELPRFRGTKHLRVAVWANDEVSPVAGAVEQRVRDVARLLAEGGATVDEAARPDFTSEHTGRVYRALLSGFLGGVQPPPAYEALVGQADALAPDDHTDAAEMLRAQTMSHHTWLGFHDARAHLRWAWHRFFQDWDLLVTPICATSAFPRDEGPMGARRIDVDGQEQGHYLQLFWAGLSGLPELPSTIVPTGPGADGLPIGVQLIGPAWGDRVTIGAAAALEAAGCVFRAPPGY